MSTPLLLDCDPGNDDALAILCAAGDPRLDLRAVTTGAGHLAADRTARNAAIVVAMIGLPVPVTAGAAVPLVRERLIAGILDQTAALDPERPELVAVPLDPRPSAVAIIETASAAPGLTIACTGPLTNLGLALRLDPGLAGRIGRVVALGGAWGLGNKTAAAEWNILCDPEAAAIVYGSGVPITMVPVDATAAVGIDAALVAGIDRAHPAGAFVVELLQSLRRTHRPGLFGPAEASLNDPLAVLVAADPALVRTLPARVDIELAGRHSYGRSLVDFAGRGGLPANCDVVIAFDVAAARKAFLAAIAAHCRTEEAEPI